MKKLFLIFAVSALFVACNDTATTETETPATEEVTPTPAPTDTDSLAVVPTDSLPAATATPAQ